ncbi:MAG: isoprenylcysteine carboxylmethyltransferase family protein [Hyphomicrobium sp.]|uniref:methyltransferase family protein n=1 Tax=Hyphomicrobium sp. TaxID=82 RepID=UPI003D14A0B3
MSTTSDVTVQLVTRTLVWSVLSAALLFIPAGTLAWPEGWIYLTLACGLGLLSGLILAKHDPALLKERLGSPVQKEQKGWDKLLISVFIVLFLAMYVVAGLDAVRFGISHMPVWLEGIGAAGVLFGSYVFHIVMLTNTFAAPVVKIQTERKHAVISSGPYAYVRHPMYGGAIALILGTGLLLGSWYAVAIGVAAILLLAYRSVLEEETLKRELEGYAAYAERVRHRMVPGLW